MPEARKLQPSFAAGELSPNLYARVDLDKYKAGAASLRNWYVDVRGGVSTRPGTLFCGYSGTQVQPGDVIPANGNAPFATGSILRPFIVGQGLDDSYVLEFGQFDLTSGVGYVRFWQAGAPFLDPAIDLTITGATNANPCVVTAANSFVGGEWIIITGVVGMPQLNGAWQVVSPTGAHFEIAPIPFFGAAAVDSTAWGTWTSGGTVTAPLTLTTPYLLGDLLNLKFAQSADVIVLTHPSYYPATITLKSGTFTFADVNIEPTQKPPTSLVVSDGGTTDPDYCWSYCVTSTSLDGKSESVQSNIYFKHYTIPDDVTGWAESLKWTGSTTPSLYYTIYKCGPFDDRDATGPGTIWGKIGQSQSPTFHDNNIPPDYNIAPPIFGDPFSGGQLESIEINVAAGGAPSGRSWTGYLPLTFTGGGGSGAAGFAVTDYNGNVTGAFLTNSGKGYTSFPTVTDPSTATTYTGTVSSATPTFPACAAFYQQRLLLGGANSQPDTMALSVPGDYFNYNTTPISQPTDAFPVDIAGTEVDTIQSLMPVSYGCLIFTTGGVYMMNGGGTSQDITPSTIAFVPQAADGANALQPLRINWSVLYNQFRGCVVRELAFAWQRQGYVGDDISAAANHLFFGFNILNWTWSEALWRNVLAVRDDGHINCLTYQPEQEVRGWCPWDTQGSYLSIVSIPEGNFDINYASVVRHVQLASGDPCWTTYIERFDDRNWDCALDAWCLDCAISAPVNNPAYPLFLTELNPDGTVQFQLYDPCTNTVPGGTGPFASTDYIMEAKENFDPTHRALVDGGLVNTSPYTQLCSTDSQIIGTSYDYARGKIMYLGFAAVCESESGHLVLNDTGYPLWDGYLKVDPGSTYNINSQLSPFIAERDVNTEEVVWWNTYNVNEVVPKGTGGIIIGESVITPGVVPNPPIINTFFVNTNSSLTSFYWAVNTAGATYLPNAHVSTDTFPYNTMSLDIAFRDYAAAIQSHVGTIAYTLTITMPFGGGPPTITLLDFGVAPGGPVTYTTTPIGGGIIQVDVSMPQGGTGTVVNIVSWELSDGTWRRIGRDFQLHPSGGNNPVIVNPRNSDCWVHAFSCELYQFRYTPAAVTLPDGTTYTPPPFAQELSPYVYDTGADSLPNNPAVMTVGLDNSWVYSLVVDQSGDSPLEAVVLLPVEITEDEILHDKKLAYATYTTPLIVTTDLGVRGTFGTDGDLYFLSLYGDADNELNFRLTQFVPPPFTPYWPGDGNSVAGGAFTDVTPWTLTTGPNLDGENYVTTTEPAPSWTAYFAFYRLPAAANEAVGLFKFFKEQYTGGSSDYNKTFLSACNLKLGAAPSFDYHSKFVTGYMTAAWATASSIPVTGYAVVNVREFDTFRDQSDFVYPDLDYSKRWLAFDCYPVASSTVVTAGGLITVFVQYQFAYGAAPVIVRGPLDETVTWDPPYTAYGSAIGNTAVVQNSLWKDDANDFGLGALGMNRDHGLTVENKAGLALWFSGQVEVQNWLAASNNMFNLDAQFVARAALNYPTNTHAVLAFVAPPFLKLTIGAFSGVVRAGCALISNIVGEGTGFAGTGQLSGVLTHQIPGDPNGLFDPFLPGEWSFNPTISSITAAHLPDKELYAVIDAMPVGPILSSASGVVPLPFTGSNVIVGLLYTCDLQTLRLEMEGVPTIQGRRKLIPAADVIVKDALGLEVGHGDFEGMYPMPDTALPLTVPPPTLQSGVFHVKTGDYWNVEGQLCFRQPWPLPATILGFVSEATIGDDAT